jgi:hypothetical protein
MTERAVSLRHLKQAMVAAHPDKGGTSEAFIEARKRYVDAKQMREGLRKQRRSVDPLWEKYWAKVRDDGKAFVEKALRHRDCLTRSQIQDIEWRAQSYFLPTTAQYVTIWGRLKTKANVQPETDYERSLDMRWKLRVVKQQVKAAYKEAHHG